MPNYSRMNDTRDRTRSPGRFVQRFSKVSAPDEVGKTLQKLAHVNRRAMKIKQSFGEDPDRNDAADKNRPHQQPTFLNVIDHCRNPLDLFPPRGKRALLARSLL